MSSNLFFNLFFLFTSCTASTTATTGQAGVGDHLMSLDGLYVLCFCVSFYCVIPGKSVSFYLHGL